MSDPSRNPLVERAERYVDRRRLIIGLCAAVIVALIAAVPGILTSDDSGRNVRTAEFAQVTPTTAAVPPAGILNPLTPQQVNAPADASPTTTAPASVLGTTFTRPPAKPAPKPAAKSAPKPAAQPASATTAPHPAGPPPPNCRNSYDPACGPFRWDPNPGTDQPRQVTLRVSSASPKIGESITVHVDVVDPDDPHAMECPSATYDYGDGPSMTTHCDPAPGSNPCPARYGPWNPPDPHTGEGHEDWSHTYSTPGPHTITFTYEPSLTDGCYNPYAGKGSGSATINVMPA